MHFVTTAFVSTVWDKVASCCKADSCLLSWEFKLTPAGKADEGKPSIQGQSKLKIVNRRETTQLKFNGIAPQGVNNFKRLFNVIQS